MKNIFKKESKKHRGIKFYGIMNENDYSYPICIDSDKDRVISCMDNRFNILVECEVRRVFIKSRLLDEIELD